MMVSCSSSWSRCAPCLVQGTKSQAATTIVLRGANDYMLDEMDRSLHDALMAIKRMLESNSLVAGGGAVEAALSIHLDKFATTLGSKEQLAISEFAEALLVIPRTLAVNAAQVGRGRQAGRQEVSYCCCPSTD